MTTHFTRQFFQALYPEPLTELGGRLVLWTRKPRARTSRSYWLADIDRAETLCGELRNETNVYFGVALQDKKRALEQARKSRPGAAPRHVRGRANTAVVLPALWVDIDVAGEGHTSKALPPDREAALALLDAVPCRPSIIVRSGGGFHVYWLLEERWILQTDDERRAAKRLLLRVEGAVRSEAQRHGWSIDSTAELARVLRVPGTFNHKTSEKRLVVVDELHPDRRYAAAHFDVLSTPSSGSSRDRVAVRRVVEGSVVEGSVVEGHVADARAAGQGGPYREPDAYDDAPADFARVHRGCPWIYHCDVDREDLPEPEWYAMLSIAGRCQGPDGESGRELAHRLSRGYRGYDPARTDRKLDQALSAAGPRGCHHIGFELGLFDQYCDRCEHFGCVAGPISLGRPEPSEALTPDPSPAHPPRPPRERGAPVRPERGKGSAAVPERQKILISTREDAINQQALGVLAASSPNLYERAGTLVQVVTVDAERLAGRPWAQAAARPVAEARLRELLAAVCDFRKTRRTSRGVAEIPVHPPLWVVRGIHGRGMWPCLPMLHGVVESPVLRRDGSVLQIPGYDRASGLYYAPAAGVFGDPQPVPDEPTAADVEDAKTTLEEVVCDFPFQRDVHLAGWLSSLLTPLARFAFDGPSPLNLIDANVRGAGKSLLADAVTKILSGREAARMPYTRDEDEFRKSITSLALEGSQTVLIDNVRGAFGSAALECVLTTSIWRDRLLGMNTKVTLPLEITWFVTGNNIALLGDIPRRCVHIRLESPEERPETREGFRHPRLLRWIGAQRPRLLSAALTLLRAYVAAGRPDQQLPSWGSFEEWSDVVRNAVVWLGYPDPAETTGELEETADISAERLFVAAFADAFAAGGATAREILDRAADPPDDCLALRSAIEDLFPRLKSGELPTPVRLGYKLRSLRGRVLDGAALQQGPKAKGGMVWRVERSGGG